MQHGNLLLVLLVAVLSFLALAVALLIKRKASRFVVIVISVAIVIIVFIGGVLIQGSRNLYIEDFRNFKVDELAYSNAVIDASLKAKAGKSGNSLGSDNLENRLMIESFNLHFRENTFANLQFTTLSYESGGPYEKNYQINYSGQLFTDPKALSLAEVSSDNVLSLRELKEIIGIISKSDVFHTVSLPAPDSITVMFNGHTRAMPEENDVSRVYIIQDENIIPLSYMAYHQEVNGYFVFSIVSEKDYLQILYPQYKQ